MLFTLCRAEARVCAAYRDHRRPRDGEAEATNPGSTLASVLDVSVRSTGAVWKPYQTSFQTAFPTGSDN